MNIFASNVFGEAVAEIYFPGRRAAIENVRVGDSMLRLLVVDGRQVVARSEFLDYHEPLKPPETDSAARAIPYIERIVHGIIEDVQWERPIPEGVSRAPFVDWSAFATFEAYWDYIVARNKRLLRKHNKTLLGEIKRRRQKLIDAHGALTFTMNDTRDDVFDLAFAWKRRQLLATGKPDYFADPKSIAFLDALRARGALTSSTLRAGDRLIAAWIGAVHEGAWSGWIFTYDPALKNFSPGHQLLRFMLEESHRLGHREFNFSFGEEDYKYLYATHARLIGPMGRESLRCRLLSRMRRTAKGALHGGQRRLAALLPATRVGS